MAGGDAVHLKMRRLPSGSWQSGRNWDGSGMTPKASRNWGADVTLAESRPRPLRKGKGLGQVHAAGHRQRQSLPSQRWLWKRQIHLVSWRPRWQWG